MTKCRSLGLIVNPVAGMGGSIGLKGTDGTDTLLQAIELGAEPRAARRAIDALRSFERLADRVRFMAPRGEMGARELQECGLRYKEIEVGEGPTTSREDTQRAAEMMVRSRVELILFAGGDGTACDICAVIGDQIPVLGIPAGVKIQSAVFGVSPKATGEIAARFVIEGSTLSRAEVMDIDEEEARRGRVSARLFGYMHVPNRRLLQVAKARSGVEEVDLLEIGRETRSRMRAGTRYVIGPGTTTRAVLQELGIEGTLLGVDVVCDGLIMATDVAEMELLRLVDGYPSMIIVSPIGGQGFIFGRGNQQISADVINAVGLSNVMVIASDAKLASLEGRPLRVDTDDYATNRDLTGYVRVVTGKDREAVYRVAS